MHKQDLTSERDPRHHSNTGLFALSQNELKNELKRIELSRRQYELAYVHEQRKLITRIANKLIHSKSNLDVIFRPSKRKQSQQQLKQWQQSEVEAESPSTSSIPPPSPLPSKVLMSRGITYIGFPSSATRTQPYGASRQTKLSRPITSLPSITYNSNDDRFAKANQEAAIVGKKKAVKWGGGVKGGGIVEQHQTVDSKRSFPAPSSAPTTNKPRVISMYELNKKYDELRLKFPDRQPEVLLPLLVSSSRRPSEISLLGSWPNSEHVAVLDERRRRRLDECKHTFLNMMESEESGFYSYKKSNGQPVCLGYDNYAVLLDSSASNQSKLNVIRPAAAVIISTQLGKKVNKKPMTHAAQSSEQSSSKPVDSIDSELLRLKVEEENKLCNDTFKAQNIKSLTFKSIVTY